MTSGSQPLFTHTTSPRGPSWWQLLRPVTQSPVPTSLGSHIWPDNHTSGIAQRWPISDVLSGSIPLVHTQHVSSLCLCGAVTVLMNVHVFGAACMSPIAHTAAVHTSTPSSIEVPLSTSVSFVARQPEVAPLVGICRLHIQTIARRCMEGMDPSQTGKPILGAPKKNRSGASPQTHKKHSGASLPTGVKADLSTKRNNTNHRHLTITATKTHVNQPRSSHSNHTTPNQTAVCVANCECRQQTYKQNNIAVWWD
jgi:hypothetical protein